MLLNKQKKQITGEVISDKGQKTVVVKVERIKEHPRYKKRYKVHKKYKAHDEKDEYKVGDKVIIEECRPISKEKRWKVIKRLASHIGEGSVSGPEAKPSAKEKTPEMINE